MKITSNFINKIGSMKNAESMLLMVLALVTLFLGVIGCSPPPHHHM